MSIVAKRLDGTEVDLGQGHFVLGGFPAVSERGTAAPLFSALTYCVHSRPSQLLLSSCCFLLFLFIGSVRQIKLAIRQLLGACT